MAPVKKEKTPTHIGTIFYVNVNLEGFWNYDQTSLQVEDIYEVLATIPLQFDFLLLLDQSSDHGKMREGALSVNTNREKDGVVVKKIEEIQK